jgi:hypothetical protein
MDAPRTNGCTPVGTVATLPYGRDPSLRNTVPDTVRAARWRAIHSHGIARSDEIAPLRLGNLEIQMGVICNIGGFINPTKAVAVAEQYPHLSMNRIADKMRQER